MNHASVAAGLACAIPPVSRARTIGIVPFIKQCVRRTHRSLFFGALVLAVSPLPVHTQSANGNIVGTVTAAGKPLRGALVSVNAVARTAVTDERGRFRLATIPAGTVQVDVRAVGWEPRRQQVIVQSGGTLQLDIVLTTRGSALAQVAVTADRNVSDLAKIPASMSVIGANQIESRAALLPGDELTSTAGVIVTRPYDGETAYLTVRGVPNRHSNDTFLTLVDGVPMISSNDEADLARLVPPSLLERVEVVKGPVSALYGRGGVAGAINYITKAASGAPRVEGGVITGSFGLLRPYATLSLPITKDRHTLLLSGFSEARQGWRTSSDRRNGNVFAKDEWRFGRQTQLTTSFNWQDSEGRNPSHIPLRADGSRVTLPIGDSQSRQIPNNGVERSLWMLTSSLAHTFSDAFSVKATLHQRSAALDANLGFADSFDESSNTFVYNGFRGVTESTTRYAELQSTWRPTATLRMITGGSLERVRGHGDEFWTGQYGFDPVTFGFDFYAQRVNATTGQVLNASRFITDRLLNADFDANIGAAYTQLDWAMSPRARLSVGARWDRFTRDVAFGPTTSEGVTQPTGTGKDTDGHLSPKVSLDLSLREDLSAWTSFSEGFSPAFGPVWAFRNRDADLKPEIARNAEVGLKGRLFGGRANFTAALFQLRRNDLLQLVASGGASPKPTNAGEQRSQGVEFESQFGLGSAESGWTGFTSYTYTDSKWIDNVIPASFGPGSFDFSGKYVPNVPFHLASLGLTKRWRAVSVGGWVDYTGHSWMTGDNTVRNPGYALTNATFSWNPKFMSQGAILLTATNLLDERYYVNFATSTGPREAYPGRRREVIATLRWTR